MATRFQLGTISTQAAPAGVVQAFAGAVAPTGWLLCNGAAVSRATYAALFAAIASAHGSGDGSTTFNLPDYRGRIIRGRDGGIARDPDRATRTAAAAGGNTGDNVGSVQAEATKKNGLTATTSGTNSSSAISGTSDGGTLVGYENATANAFRGIAAYVSNINANIAQTTHTHGLSGTAAAQSWSGTTTIGAGDNETRPLNAYVNYIIKV